MNTASKASFLASQAYVSRLGKVAIQAKARNLTFDTAGRTTYFGYNAEAGTAITNSGVSAVLSLDNLTGTRRTQTVNGVTLT